MKGNTPKLVGAALLALGLTLSPLRAQDAAPKPLDLLVQTLSHIDAPDAQASILRGMSSSLKGRHGLSAPAGWDALYDKLKASPNAEVRREALSLGVTFGGAAALEEERKTLSNASADPAARLTALEALLSVKDGPSLPVLLQLAREPGPLRAPTLRGLAEYEDPQITPALLDVFKTLDTAEKRDALNTLLARPPSAHAFLAAIDSQALNRSEINAPVARQLQDLHDPEIDAWLAKNYGAVRTSPDDKKAAIAKLKAFLTTDSILHADVNRGRAIFTATCAICHTLFGYGAKIGPELPGSFEDIDYLLLNIVDPDAIIGKDYQQVLVHTKDGQTVSGIIASDDGNAVSLKSLAGIVTVQRSDITSMEVSPHSLMPEGLITSLPPQDVRDLFLYLRQRGQVPLLATPFNASDFFDGNDLARWRPSSEGGWKVENGEIVGHGAANKAVSLRSEMIAGDFKLTAMLKLSGADPIVEVAYRGRPDLSPFVGDSLSLGRNAKVNVWHYLDGTKVQSTLLGKIVKTGQWTKCEIAVKGVQSTITIDDVLVMFLPLPPSPHRNGFSFYLQGADSELRVKDVKLEIEGK
jgi:putative heme-binding domain-containing protein